MEEQQSFTAPIGVEVKGEMWACVEVPGAAELFAGKRSKRADIEIDGLTVPNIGFLPTGNGGYMFSLNAALRKKLGKDIGDMVAVRVVKIL